MQITPAKPHHLDTILKIYNDAILSSVATFDTETKTKESFSKSLQGISDIGYPVSIISEDETVCGFGLLKPFSERLAYLPTCELSLYLIPIYQGQGMGKIMMTHLIEEAQKLGLHSIVSRIESSSEPSIKLHEGHGFTHVGTLQQVGFKFDRWLDVCLYQKLLS